MKYKEVLPEKTPACEIPYRSVNQPFRLKFVIPGPGIRIMEDANGVCYISTVGGTSLEDLVAGDNIEINRTEDGKVVISSVNTATNIAAGQNISIDIDPATGTAIINSIIGGPTNEHYKGVFDTPEDLIEAVPEPEIGDYGMIKNIVITNGEATWNGQYKYCFYINGLWTVVDQMLTFTQNLDLLQQFYSVGGSSPVIYLHEVARSGNFWDLNNIPIVATPVVTVEGTTVTATCDTPGAEIWYSTDGSMPHVNGTKYTGPITATQATTYRFVGIKNGMINSLEAVASADYELQAPTIDLDWHDGTITMTNPNEDGNGDPVGTIYYTTDGTTPTNASNAYTGPFVLQLDYIDRQKTVKAVVYDPDNAVYSPVSEETYERANIVGHSWSGAGNGDLTEFWLVSQSSSDFSQSSDGEAHYTIDNSTPSYSSSEMTSVLTFRRYGSAVPLKIIGLRPGYLPSVIRIKTVGYEKPTAPVISFDADTNEVTLSATGNVTATPSVPMQTNNDNPNFGYRIYYTTDGSTPTAATGTLYTGPFQISGNTTVKAVIVAYGQYYSDVTTDSIVITNLPVISLNSNTGEISISGPEGSTLHYTTNGSEPTAESPVYSSPITVLETEASITVKAIAVDGGSVSGTATATYTRPTTSAYLDFSPNYTTGNVYAAIHRPTGTGLITYTDNGNLPTYQDTEFPDQYLTLQRFMANPPVLTLREFKEGYLPAFVRVYDTSLYGIYAAPDAPSITYDEDTDIVTMALTGNTVDIPLQTNNNTPTLGARIWYTTDGSTPDSSTATLFTGPFTLPEGVTTIKAITECYGEDDSDVTTEEISGGGGTYGVRFAKNSDSADGTRVGDMTLHVSLPIQSGMKRCLLLDNGTVNYYLDPDDSTKKADGTAADLTGADGQYMVEIPEFYAALLETDDYVEFSVSTDPVDGYFHYPTMYVSADEACLDRATGKLAAVVNDTANYRGGSNDASKDSDPYLTLLQRPVSNISWQDFLDAAQLRGSGWCNYMNMVNSALYFLFITEYATRDTQKAYNPALTAEGYRQGGIGPDATEFYDWSEIDNEPFIPTGFTASLGNNTGVKDLSVQWESEGQTKTHTARVSSYRGVSVPIGHLAKAASGYFLRATSAEDVYAYFRNNPDTMSYDPVAGDISVRVPLTIGGQLVCKLGFADGNLYPEEGTEDPISDPTQPLTTYYCDGAFVYGSDLAPEIYDPEFPVSLVPVLGGFAYGGSYCGFACADFGGGPSNASPTIGSRLCFISNN